MEKLRRNPRFMSHSTEPQQLPTQKAFAITFLLAPLILLPLGWPFSLVVGAYLFAVLFGVLISCWIDATIYVGDWLKANRANLDRYGPSVHLGKPVSELHDNAIQFCCMKTCESICCTAPRTRVLSGFTSRSAYTAYCRLASGDGHRISHLQSKVLCKEGSSMCLPSP